MSSLAFFGSHCLSLALPAALLSLLFYLIGYRQSRSALVRSAERGVVVTWVLISAAVGCLVAAFLTNDFSIHYVWGYSNRSLPLFYKLAGLWAGLDGSILFWTWLVSLYAVIVCRQNRDKNADWMPYINAVMMGVILFFLTLMLLRANPFMPSEQIMADGKGLNPLLQNIAMVIHPPMLYLGFTGFTVPFAYVVAALITRRLDSLWIEDSRRWTLVAWMFLGIGLLLGGAWAYVELGWGGFWAWDPVENAALMPWLIATAYLHSVMIQKKRGMLMVWNVSLIMLAFILTIFGTYLTRSGVVQSVHAFSESEVGAFFLGFIIVTILGSVYLVTTRLSGLKSKNDLQSYLSKESAFLINNVLLVIAVFAVIWGTMFPTLSEWVKGERITVGAPFFNRIMAPIGLALLFLMGVGPVISWKRATPKNFRANLLWPLVAAVVVGLGSVILGLRQWYAIASAALIALVVMTHYLELYRGIRVVKQQKNYSTLSAAMDLLIRSNRRYGGYVVHMGVVMIFVGIAGTVFKTESDFALMPEESYSFQGYQFTYIEPIIRESEHKVELGARVAVYRGGRKLTELTPSKNIYNAKGAMGGEPTTEVDIYLTPLRDVYMIIGNLNTESGKADFRVTINPLISFMWLGGIVIVAGTLLILLPHRSRSRSKVIAACFCTMAFFGTPHGTLWAQDPNPMSLKHDAGDPFITMDEKNPTVTRLKTVSEKLICTCGGCVRMSLRTCTCDFAKDERAKILAMMTSGNSDDEILKRFTDKHGLSVLTVPPEKGFFLVGYWLPLASLVGALLFIALLIRVWYRRSKATQASDTAPALPLDTAYAKRLSEELKEFE